jgi:NitT/TauT family transport system substrate-binding protein
LRGLADTLADPTAAFSISTQFVEGLAENAELGRAVLDATLPFWRAEMLGHSDEETWLVSQQVMQDAGLMDSPSEIDELFTNEFLADPRDPGEP